MSATTRQGQFPPLCREAWPRHTSKKLAAALGCPVETARNYVRAKSLLSADALMRAADRDDALRAALIRRLTDARTARADSLVVPACAAAAVVSEDAAEAC